jgi:hypothetical protein
VPASVRYAITSSDMLAAAKTLRDRLGCSASCATSLALGRSLIGEPLALPQAAEEFRPRNIS